MSVEAICCQDANVLILAEVCNVNDEPSFHSVGFEIYGTSRLQTLQKPMSLLRLGVVPNLLEVG